MNDLETILKILAALQAGTLISIVVYGYKVIRFFNTIEFKTDLMWTDYQRRIDNSDNLYFHKRSSDPIEK